MEDFVIIDLDGYDEYLSPRGRELDAVFTDEFLDEINDYLDSNPLPGHKPRAIKPREPGGRDNTVIE